MKTTRGSLLRIASSLTAIVVALTFLTMPAEEYPGDAHAVRAETVTLLNTGQWAVPADLAVTFGPRGQYFYEKANGNWYPKYGVLNTLMYAPALALEKIATGSLEVDSDSRLLFLNLFNVLLSGVTALYLILLAQRYTKSRAIISVFVLASLFSTFWWNYLRTQTFETYHILFMVAFYYHFVSALDVQQSDNDERKPDIQFLLAAIYLGAFCLSKTVYVALLPAVIAVSARGTMSILFAKRKNSVRRQLLFFWLPAGLFLCLLAATNWYKFDSPFATGYTQWEEERNLFSVANVLPALWGFLFSPHHSVFLHFPLLFFALAGWPVFFKKHRVDAIAAALFGLALLLVNSAFTNWSGQSAYGPRYLLPVLPLLCLPFIEYMEWLKCLPKMAKSVLAVGTTAVLAYATLLQLCVNTLPFFFCYTFKDVLDDTLFSEPATYLRSHNFGTINRDFLLFKLGYASPFRANFISHLNPDETERMSELNKSLQTNYYWFPNLFRDDE